MSERGKSGSIVTWLILGVLALAFGLTFGLPSDQLSVGESALLKVHGKSVTREEFFYQQAVIQYLMGAALPEGEQAQAMGVREEVLESVIERHVLAEAGRDLGLASEKVDAEMWTRDALFLGLGQIRPMPWATASNFDYELLKRVISQFTVSEAKYLELQTQELLAQQVRDLVLSSVTVPEAELWAQYEKDNDQLSLRYVKFSAPDYAELVDPTDAELDDYIETNAAALQETWEINQDRFLKLPAQLDLRLIEFSKPVAPPTSASEEQLADHAAKLEAAKAAALLARERIVTGGESFASVARELSKHSDTARSGGRFGWTGVNVGSGLEPLIDDAAKTLEDKVVSELLVGEEGLYLVMVASRREGDVSEQVAKRELASDAVRSARGRDLAKRAADEALLAVQGGSSLDKLFSAGAAALGQPGAVIPGKTIEDIPVDGQAPVANELAPKIKVEETGLFNKAEEIPKLGSLPALVQAAWAAAPDTSLIEQVFDVPGGFLIATIDERSTATKEGYAAERETLYTTMQQRRANSVLSGFTKHRCFIAKAKVEIRVNEKQVKRILSYGVETPKDENGIPLVPPYRVCERVGDGGGLLRLAMMMRGRPPGS